MRLVFLAKHSLHDSVSIEARTRTLEGKKQKEGMLRELEIEGVEKLRHSDGRLETPC